MSPWFRACYFAMKADLKARVYAHNLQRNYQCNLNLHFVRNVLFFFGASKPHNCPMMSTHNAMLLLLRMCDRCLARQGKGAPLAMHYKNFSDNKAWPLTILSHEGYLHFDQFSLTPWLVVPGFKMETMTWDLLHNIYLGTARDLVGSGLKTLVMRGCYDYLGEGLDMDTILSHVDAKIRRDCSRYKFLAFGVQRQELCLKFGILLVDSPKILI